ncbi:hypothetical protein BGZ60DRAFT_409331 [Tricladium varicosporioides]|nr:hypothetical protein BGZ60DRAFT_409331 [Hymenoscyphus varicosporioides]
MALSTNAARALEQVKMGLYMLYGADYFTEDEWIKIDGLIHKGSYVFTRGPPTSLLEVTEEELMTFEDTESHTINNMGHLQLQTKAIDTFSLAADLEVPVIAEKGEEVLPPLSELAKSSTPGPSNSSEEPLSLLADNAKDSCELERTTKAQESPLSKPASLDLLSSNPSSTATSAVAESNEPRIQKNRPAKDEPLSDTLSDILSSATTPPLDEPKREPVKIPGNGGLSLGYTQAQLDEIKAFNASLTKAGQKSRPKYKKEAYEDNSSQPIDYLPQEVEAHEPQSPPSIAHAEKADRIHTWASEVNTQVIEIEQVPPQNSTENTPVSADTRAALVEGFARQHGRLPKALNDVLQPNNPQFKPPHIRPPKRPDSRMSTKTATSVTRSKGIASVIERLGGALEDVKLVPGIIAVAQNNHHATHLLGMEVQAGDQISILKHVSGTLYFGRNIRTNKTGQFQESIFKNPRVNGSSADLIACQQNLAAQKAAPSPVHLRNGSVSTTYSTGLDRVEGMNAAEWDDVPILTGPRQRAKPTPSRPAVKNGLMTSRFAVLADEGKASDGDQEFVHHMTREQVDKIVDEKFHQILKRQGITPPIPVNAIKAPAGPRNRSKEPLKEPLRAVIPKTVTCWFWATPNKDCRFTAEECRDLHEHTPFSSGDPANLREGKPTWAALTDCLDPSTTKTPPDFGIGSGDARTTGDEDSWTNTDTNDRNYGKKLGKTCHYWAQGGKCQYTADECKFLHSWGENGVAPSPGQWGKKGSSDWNRWQAAGKGKDIGSSSWWEGKKSVGSAGDGKDRATPDGGTDTGVSVPATGGADDWGSADASWGQGNPTAANGWGVGGTGGDWGAPGTGGSGWGTGTGNGEVGWGEASGWGNDANVDEAEPSTEENKASREQAVSTDTSWPDMATATANDKYRPPHSKEQVW